MLSFKWMIPEPNLRVLPLRTPTLPPAQTTNTSFVGHERIWVVDPATPYGQEQEVLLAAIRAEENAGRTLAGLVLTHHHPDHVGAADWLRGKTGAEIWAHPKTAQLLSGSLRIDHLIEDGDTLSGSAASDDTWTVLHTPGHASGHIVLFQPKLGALIAGDMVAAVGTILVEHPDGDMAEYITQLERLRDLGARCIVPAHGPVIEDPEAHFTHYISHRLAREKKVYAAVQAEPRSLREITRDAYRELDESLHGLALRSTLAHLVKLEREDRVESLSQDEWRIVPAQ